MTDLDKISAEWLQQCGPHDFAVDWVGCACPSGDYRPVMMSLVEEIERLRGENAALVRQAVDEAAQLRGELEWVSAAHAERRIVPRRVPPPPSRTDTDTEETKP